MTLIENARAVKAVQEAERAVLEEKGFDMAGVPFAEYKGKIAELNPPPAVPYDPWGVYYGTRNPEWFDMPEPEENEIYFLFLANNDTSHLAFTVYTDSGDYKVELGTVEGRRFTARDSYTYASQAKCELLIDAGDWDTALSSGEKQIMVRVTPAAGNITRFYLSPYTGVLVNGYETVNWQVKDLWVNCPLITAVNTCPDISTSGYAYINCWNLHYIRIKGANRISAPHYFCCSTRGLICVVEYVNHGYVSNASGMYYLGRYCSSLQAIPPLTTNGIQTTYFMQNCSVLRSFELLGAPPYGANVSTFANAYCLEQCVIDTSGYKLLSITNCYALKRFTLNTAAMTGDVSFTNAFSFTELEIVPGGLAPASITITNSAMSRSKLVEMFGQLPAADTPRNLTITSALGAGDLTVEDIAVANDKNWTVVT